MKIKILRNLGIGGVFRKNGDIVEVSYALAMELIGGGRAVAVSESKPAEVITESVVTKTESVAPPLTKVVTRRKRRK